MLQHNLRLLDALSEHRFPAWPRAGPIAINETHPDRGWERLYLVDRWCHLGTTKDEKELWSPLESSRRNEINAIEFDPDVYKVLRKYLSGPQRHDVAVLPQRPCVASA